MKKLTFHIDRLILWLLVFLTTDKQQLLSIYDDMNSWRYPTLFKEYEPDYFRTLEWYFRAGIDDQLKAEAQNMCRMTFIDLTRNLLHRRLTEKEVLGHHWLVNLNRTYAEFEHWWSTEYDPKFTQHGRLKKTA